MPARWAFGRAAGVMLAVVMMLAGPGRASERATDFGASARIDAARVVLRSDMAALELALPLSQPVPWRARVLSSPPRLVLDLNTVDWRVLRPEALRDGAGPAVRAVRLGQSGGWARLVIDLAGTYRLERAALEPPPGGDGATLRLVLARVPMEAFSASAQPEDAFAARFGDALLHPAPTAMPAPERRPLVVVLDPGHGGIDPGAERGGLRESDLMLGFARELREALLRAGGFEVVMTRDADVFVSLDGRIRAARAAQADVFLSLHADALPDGVRAAGATIYALSEEASDRAAAILAERHDRADLLAGVDLRRAEDAIAEVLMSLTRTETRPRTDALAGALLDSMRAKGLRLHPRPQQAGAFSVLRAPDVPSLLIELGFMSNARDLANLQDPQWRERMQAALVDGLRAWKSKDRASAPLRRH